MKGHKSATILYKHDENQAYVPYPCVIMNSFPVDSLSFPMAVFATSALMGAAPLSSPRKLDMSYFATPEKFASKDTRGGTTKDQVTRCDCMAVKNVCGVNLGSTMMGILMVSGWSSTLFRLTRLGRIDQSAVSARTQAEVRTVRDQRCLRWRSHFHERDEAKYRCKTVSRENGKRASALSCSSGESFSMATLKMVCIVVKFQCVVSTPVTKRLERLSTPL